MRWEFMKWARLEVLHFLLSESCWWLLHRGYPKTVFQISRFLWREWAVWHKADAYYYYQGEEDGCFAIVLMKIFPFSPNLLHDYAVVSHQHFCWIGILVHLLVFYQDSVTPVLMDFWRLPFNVFGFWRPAEPGTIDLYNKEYK